jgi:hypothetical protein
MLTWLALLARSDATQARVPDPDGRTTTRLRTGGVLLGE